MERVATLAILLALTVPAQAWAQHGMASVYAPSFAGKRMADGTRYSPAASNCAHRTARMHAELELRTPGHVAYCRVADRGPYVRGRIVDLPPVVAAQLGITRKVGVMPVVITEVAEMPMKGKR